jgi:hypothetical protein
LRGYRLLPAVLGALCLEAGGFKKAAAYFEVTLLYPFSRPERRLLEARLAKARKNTAGPAQS